MKYANSQHMLEHFVGRVSVSNIHMKYAK